MSELKMPVNKESVSSDVAGYLSTRTITALCSPTGGALSVVRISGTEAFLIAEKLTTTESKNWGERKANQVWIRDQRKIDHALMIAFQGPRSFTGEDVIELYLHGSPLIAQKVLEKIFSLGARLALPGEFSFRAVKNGKMTLSQAEAVKDIIASENDFSLDLAIEKLSGTQHELIQKIQAELVQLMTLSEVGIDFSDQDIDEVSLPKLKGRSVMVLNELKKLQGSFDRGKRFMDGIPVSIFGLPNAGKSSFFNALLGEDRSIISEIAGTTRDVVREKIHLHGAQGRVTFKISDTAGFRKGPEQIEKIGIEKSLKAAQESDLILVIADGLSPHPQEILFFLNQVSLKDKKLLGLISKKDLVSEATQENTLKEIKDKMGTAFGDWIWISSQSLDGISKVAEKMTELSSALLSRKEGEVVLTRIEHLQAVELAIISLEGAAGATDPVLFAADLRHTVAALGPLIGETLPDDILGKIFSDFCIGK